MNTTLKSVLIILNCIVLILAIFWTFNDSPVIEPLIVIAGQVIALSVLFFEKKLPFINVKTVSRSDVEIDVPSDDKSDIKVEKIRGGSKVKIERRDVK